MERSLAESILYLDRPVVPEPIGAGELGPRFCIESLRIDGLLARRRPLSERFLTTSPVAV